MEETLNKLLFSAIDAYNKLEASITSERPSVIIRCIINDKSIVSISIHQYLRKNSVFYKNVVLILNDVTLGICTLPQLIKIFKLKL